MASIKVPDYADCERCSEVVFVEDWVWSDELLCPHCGQAQDVLSMREVTDLTLQQLARSWQVIVGEVKEEMREYLDGQDMHKAFEHLSQAWAFLENVRQ